MVKFINFGTFGQATVVEMSSFVTLLTFKVTGGTIEVCGVSCITTSHADGQVYFWFLVVPFLHLGHCIDASAGVSGYPHGFECCSYLCCCCCWLVGLQLFWLPLLLPQFLPFFCWYGCLPQTWLMAPWLGPPVMCFVVLLLDSSFLSHWQMSAVVRLVSSAMHFDTTCWSVMLNRKTSFSKVLWVSSRYWQSASGPGDVHSIHYNFLLPCLSCFNRSYWAQSLLAWGLECSSNLSQIVCRVRSPLSIPRTSIVSVPCLQTNVRVFYSCKPLRVFPTWLQVWSHIGSSTSWTGC